MKSQKVWIEIRLVPFFARSPINNRGHISCLTKPTFFTIDFFDDSLSFLFFLPSGDLNLSSTFCDRGGGGLVVGMTRL